jgi:hypothetical protein
VVLGLIWELEQKPQSQFLKSSKLNTGKPASGDLLTMTFELAALAGGLALAIPGAADQTADQRT